MSASFPNTYHHRKVAEASAKSCDICYKPSTSVLITPDSKDFFYVCPIHLKDRHFCTPKIDEAAVKAKRDKALAEETEKLKREYEEKQRKKKANAEKNKKDEDKDKDGKDKGKDKDKDENEKKDKDDDEEKVDSAKDGDVTAQDEEPRVFELKNTFYNQRQQKKRQAETARRDRERAMQSGYFPSVPTDTPGK